VDLGVKTPVILSDGTSELDPRHLRHCLRKVKRLQRAVSRQQKGSRDRRKAVPRRGKLYCAVANQRANTLHHPTNRLAKTESTMVTVVIEDLNVAGILKNHHLAQAIGDVGYCEFRRQLTYKAAWYGCQALVASRWEPIAKTHSGCGWVDADRQLGDRTFHCRYPHSHLVLGRDLNAAIHLAMLAGSSSESRNTYGEERAGYRLATAVKLSPLKQEPNTLYPIG
jgi:putative transposase